MAGINELAKEANVTEEQVKSVFSALKTQTELRGGSVIIKGFGTFKTVTRAERTARNPQTGGEVLVPAKTVLTFKAAKPAKPKK